jgi:hypothetical protein
MLQTCDVIENCQLLQAWYARYNFGITEEREFRRVPCKRHQRSHLVFSTALLCKQGVRSGFESPHVHHIFKRVAVEGLRDFRFSYICAVDVTPACGGCWTSSERFALRLIERLGPDYTLNSASM